MVLFEKKEIQYRAVLVWIDDERKPSLAHCVSTKGNKHFETVLFVVTAHAFRIQDVYNPFLDYLTAAEEASGDDEILNDHEFILAEPLPHTKFGPH